MWTSIKPISASFDRPTGRGYADAMKLAAALILTATASTCSEPSDEASRTARNEAIAATAEVICRDGGRASALSDIVEATQESPHAGIGAAVYDEASKIEQAGCAQVVRDNQAEWQQQDETHAAIMADVEAAAKK